MKISYQWILAAIVVLLIILVGAYVLANGNNTPATNATATPTTTITPTATAVASPSVTPSTVATATPAATTNPTPTATPTASGASGVKLTDFGYYITYPPFSQNDVHVNPNYVENQGNVVYFSPTSDSITVDNTPVLELGSEGDYDAHAIIHRSGDTSGTVNATIHIALPNEDANIIDDWDLDYSVARYDSSSGDYIVTFGPGETQKDIGIIIYPVNYFDDGSAQQVSASEPMTITITNVDGGFSIGSGNIYTLNVYSNIVNPTPNPDVTVSFQDASRSYNDMGEGNMYDQHVELVRTGDSTNPLTVNVILDQITEDVSLGDEVTFNAGSSTASFYYTVYGKGVDVEEPDVYTYHIEPDSDFTVVTPGTFTIYATYEPADIPL